MANRGADLPTIYKLAMAVAALLLYGMAYAVLSPLIGAMAGVLGVFPVLLTALFCGLRGGMLIGLSVLLVIVVLVILIPDQTLDEWVSRNRWLGSIALVAVGAIAGWLRDLALESQPELARRLEAELVLQASEELYRQLAENLREVFWLLDRETLNVLYVSPAYESIWGRPCQNVYEHAEAWLDAVHPEDLARVEAANENLIVTGHFDVEYRVVRPDGSIRWVLDRGFPVIDEDGDVYRIVGIVEDTTERKLTEVKLRQSENRYRSTYNNTPLVMHSIDLDGRLLSVNKYWLDAMGYEAQEVIGRKSIDFLTEASRQYAVEVGLPGLARAGYSKDIVYQMVKKDGDVIDILLSAFQELDESGELTRRSCFLIDITERRQTEEDARNLRVLEERNRLSREIHDTLAQSLTEMAFQLEAAGDLISVDPDGARLGIEAARGLAKRSLGEVRRTVWDLRPHSVDAFGLTDVIQRELKIVKDDGILTSSKVMGFEPPIVAQNVQAALRIAQEALLNIRRHSRCREAVFRITFGSTGVRLCISDNGIGFDPYDDEALSSSASGGFGLTGMQERAQLSGGYFEVLSTPGLGTKIEAWVPYETTEQAVLGGNGALLVAGPSRPEGSPEDSRGTSIEIRVLVVDDYEVIRQGIGNMLERSDGVVVIGEAAFDKILELGPDVVLMDVQMPRCDGIETLKKLKESGLDVPVILLSVFSKDDYIVDGLRAGASGYLLKDVARPDLLHAIRTVSQGGSLVQPVIAGRLIERLGNPDGPDLTERELEILESLSAGSSNKDIATQLSISVRTVQFHVRNLYQKLAVRSRTQAVRVATKRRILQA